MNSSNKTLSAFTALQELSAAKDKQALNLKKLFYEKHRLEDYSLSLPDFFYDFSKQRLNQKALTALHAFAQQAQVKEQFISMASGSKINYTEKRAALHTAARHFGSQPVLYEGEDVSAQMIQINKEIKRFSEQVHNGKVNGSTGEKFTDAVIIGIGGSYLGCEFVYNALASRYSPKINLHFLSNVDIDNFGSIIKKIIPETTLWICISKSYTTTETMANLNQAKAYLKRNALKKEHHLVTITSKGSPGDNPDNPVLASFNMFDFIGGRYSVTSAVGGVPLSLAFGYPVFEEFLKGAHAMDCHALAAEENENIPLTAALISIWNSNFLGYPAQAIIPYCSALRGLAPHVQQLYMESLGKSTSISGEPVNHMTGVIIFGEPGTCAQHSFFQLAHQGQPFPIEFIGILNPVFDSPQVQSKGVTNTQELWANMLAQAKALAIGKDDPDPARCCPGNRPSSTIVLNDLSPKSVGILLSFYEARTVYEGFLLGINPFDQFGVELGKVLASDIRSKIAAEKSNTGTDHRDADPAVQYYLHLLIKGEL